MTDPYYTVTPAFKYEQIIHDDNNACNKTAIFLDGKCDETLEREVFEETVEETADFHTQSTEDPLKNVTSKRKYK